MNTQTERPARLATLNGMRPMLENFLNPVPCAPTLRKMFDDAGIPRLKTNPAAKRGGGPVYYSVAAVEKFLRQGTMPAQVATRLRGRFAEQNAAGALTTS